VTIRKIVILISFSAILVAAAVILACVLVKGNKKAVAGKTGSNSAATATGKLAYGADDLDSLVSDSP
jgi:hypothetical protein